MQRQKAEKTLVSKQREKIIYSTVKTTMEWANTWKLTLQRTDIWTVTITILRQTKSRWLTDSIKRIEDKILGENI